ncbi:dihydrodipicolinate synthase family protein [Rhodospirillum rubrum]|uniref:dihydrodipicolinate synthase family protein n=1 Tax=Rhodospirillum rubrum TaxID=1085 RepID=UPI0019054EBC|nr:dihydrodipicolinate synthase family protein [Rhodospirillum rubrum]MBK1664639.1 dihydrodipicolinate synthase family protein [Rhodospirillum rubrum]MBK1676320.1 dihydrodipicolinate synthase family protein [Rhodospirillum rubrum]
MTVDWKGVFPAVTTKFKADLSLDGDEMRRCVQAQVDAGVDGLICCGSLGEASTLDLDEKVAVVALALEVAGGRIPVLATVAEATTARACAFAKKAEEIGADGFMILPGMQYVSDGREAVAHYQAVAASVSKPLMIYNNPVAYRVDLGEEEIATLIEDPKFVAIKESSDDVRRTTTLRNRFGARLKIFGGVDNLALEGLLMGADGWVAGLVCAFPRETVAIYRLVRAGRLDEARTLYRWFVPLLELDVSTKLVQNIKLAEALACGSTETVRPPRLPLVGAERARVEAIIQTALACRPALPDLDSL